MIRPGIAASPDNQQLLLFPLASDAVTTVSLPSGESVIDATVDEEGSLYALSSASGGTKLWLYSQGSWALRNTFSSLAPRSTDGDIIYEPAPGGGAAISLTRVERTTEGLFIWGDILLFR